MSSGPAGEWGSANFCSADSKRLASGTYLAFPVTKILNYHNSLRTPGRCELQCDFYSVIAEGLSFRSFRKASANLFKGNANLYKTPWCLRAC